DNFTKVDCVSDYFTIRLNAPYDLYCFARDEARVGLDWKGLAPNYEVQRRLKGTGTWQVIAQGYWGPGSKSFYDTNVMRDTVYYYKVRSYGTFQGQRYYSDFSNTIEVRIPKINPPYCELHVYATGSNEITVSFVDMSNIEDFFEVWRAGAGEGWHCHATLPDTPGSNVRIHYIDNQNIQPCSTYYYKVRAHTSQAPAGYSGFTNVYGATAYPHLISSRDSATAYQPKVIYDANNNLYYMTYAAESLIMGSKSNNGLDWQGIQAACYKGQPGVGFWKAGFSQVDINQDGLPIIVSTMTSPKTIYRWYSCIGMAYFDADSNAWIDSIGLYTKGFDQAEPPFFPFTFKVVGDTVHLVFIEAPFVKYLTFNCSTYQSGDTITLGYAGSNICYPAMDKDEQGNLFVAWYNDSFRVCYRERIGNAWSAQEGVPVPWIGYYVSHLSLKRENNKTYIVSNMPEMSYAGGGYGLHDTYLAYSVKDGNTWHYEWIVADTIEIDTLASCGQIITSNIVLYALWTNNNWNIYYQEKVGTGWSMPICVKNTPAKSKFPQGCFDGEYISLIWTEGDNVPYKIDTAKIRVVPELEIVYPKTEEILGQRLRAGLPLQIKWTSSDNIGVVKHRVYYSLDNGNTYTQIGGDLSGSVYQLDWVVPDTTVSGLKIKIEAYDGAGMRCAREVGPFTTTKELLFNPNFEEVSEDKPYLWTTYGTGDLFEADWHEVQNGQFSAHIARSAPASYFGFYQEKIPVLPNRKYWLCGYIKTQASAGYANLAFGVWHAHPDTNHHRDFGYMSGNSDWTYVCDSLTTRSYEDTIRVMMFGNPAFVGEAWFDNLNLLIDTMPPQVMVSYPNGGESLLVEQRIQIYWYTTDNVKMGRIDSVLYSTNGGQTWNTIAVNLPANQNSCEWTVPVWSEQYKIRVVASDASGNRARDESDACFSTKYFEYSGFEWTDPGCLENVIVGSQGVIDAGAVRVSGGMNGCWPHTGNFMFKIWGTDTATTQNSYVVFKVFPYDFIVSDSTYFSFWLWIEQAPTDSGHICMDAYTKDGQILRGWNKFGYILDQTGQRIHPALHKAPKGQWCQYVFTFNPAVCETISEIHLIYDDSSDVETGYFEGYIDDIAVLDSFPILETWHAEKFPVHPTYGDPNFYMNFVAQGDSVRLIINPQGDSGEGQHWVGPVPGIRNDITDIPVNPNTMLYWEQYDKEHSLIL
ncbi:MAG: hypothetical protein ACPL28_11925, partial [bacterium]